MNLFAVCFPFAFPISSCFSSKLALGIPFFSTQIPSPSFPTPKLGLEPKNTWEALEMLIPSTEQLVFTLFSVQIEFLFFSYFSSSTHLPFTSYQFTSYQVKEKPVKEHKRERASWNKWQKKPERKGRRQTISGQVTPKLRIDFFLSWLLLSLIARNQRKMEAKIQGPSDEGGRWKGRRRREGAYSQLTNLISSLLTLIYWKARFKSIIGNNSEPSKGFPVSISHRWGSFPLSLDQTGKDPFQLVFSFFCHLVCQIKLTSCAILWRGLITLLSTFSSNLC